MAAMTAAPPSHIDSDDLLDNSGDAASAFFEGAGLHGQETPGNPLSAEPSQPAASVDLDFLEDDILGSPAGAGAGAEQPCDILQQSLQEANITEQTLEAEAELDLGSFQLPALQPVVQAADGAPQIFSGGAADLLGLQPPAVLAPQALVQPPDVVNKAISVQPFLQQVGLGNVTIQPLPNLPGLPNGSPGGALGLGPIQVVGQQVMAINQPAAPQLLAKPAPVAAVGGYIAQPEAAAAPGAGLVIQKSLPAVATTTLNGSSVFGGVSAASAQPLTVTSGLGGSLVPAPNVIIHRTPTPIQPKPAGVLQQKLYQITPKPFAGAAAALALPGEAPAKAQQNLTFMAGKAAPNVVLQGFPPGVFKPPPPQPPALGKSMSVHVLNQGGSIVIPAQPFQGQNQFLLPGQLAGASAVPLPQPLSALPANVGLHWLHGQETPGNPLSAEPSQPAASVDLDFLEDDILGSPAGAGAGAEQPCDILQQSLQEANITEQTLEAEAELDLGSFQLPALQPVVQAADGAPQIFSGGAADLLGLQPPAVLAPQALVQPPDVVNKAISVQPFLQQVGLGNVTIQPLPNLPGLPNGSPGGALGLGPIQVVGQQVMAINQPAAPQLLAKPAPVAAVGGYIAQPEAAAAPGAGLVIQKSLPAVATTTLNGSSVFGGVSAASAQPLTVTSGLGGSLVPAPNVIIHRTPTPIQPKPAGVLQQKLYQITPKPFAGAAGAAALALPGEAPAKAQQNLTFMAGKAAPNVVLQGFPPGVFKPPPPQPPALGKSMSVHVLNQGGSIVIPAQPFQGQNQFLLPGQLAGASAVPLPQPLSALPANVGVKRAAGKIPPKKRKIWVFGVSPAGSSRFPPLCAPSSRTNRALPLLLLQPKVPGASPGEPPPPGPSQLPQIPPISSQIPSRPPSQPQPLSRPPSQPRPPSEPFPGSFPEPPEPSQSSQSSQFPLPLGGLKAPALLPPEHPRSFALVPAPFAGPPKGGAERFQQVTPGKSPKSRIFRVIPAGAAVAVPAESKPFSGSAAPGAAPGANPGATSGANPGVTPGVTPGATPGAAPGAVPGAVPGGKAAPAPGKPGAPIPPAQPAQAKPPGLKGPPQPSGGGKGPQAPPTFPSGLARTRAFLPRCSLLEQLHKHQGAVLHPELRSPFRSLGDALRRLLPYHVYQGVLPGESECQRVDEEFEAVSEQLLRRTRAMLNKYRLLLLEESRVSCGTWGGKRRRAEAEVDKASFSSDSPQDDSLSEHLQSAIDSILNLQQPRGAPAPAPAPGSAGAAFPGIGI
ncbi:BRD4-interacting chromatin-remodeling complex-associated protein-like [Passer montanus]|uniref:BRD4-interacting chromatin-remodeling complex-associated protein-like n=1 Tax=Passer montanus TaxID=9160 RepID=UPI001961FB65|nr:BRD4-interacting chromatin-remodeling complex-associated protein-like [Passer montanus]